MDTWFPSEKHWLFLPPISMKQVIAPEGVPRGGPRLRPRWRPVPAS